MLMSVIMLFTWQVTNDARYQAPFTKALEATYAHSELKSRIDAVQDLAKAKAPAAAVIAPAVYSLGIRKQVSLTSHKITLVPETVTTYHYDERAKSGSIAVTFGF